MLIVFISFYTRNTTFINKYILLDNMHRKLEEIRDSSILFAIGIPFMVLGLVGLIGITTIGFQIDTPIFEIFPIDIIPLLLFLPIGVGTITVGCWFRTFQQ